MSEALLRAVQAGSVADVSRRLKEAPNQIDAVCEVRHSPHTLINTHSLDNPHLNMCERQLTLGCSHFATCPRGWIGLTLLPLARRLLPVAYSFTCSYIMHVLMIFRHRSAH